MNVNSVLNDFVIAPDFLSRLFDGVIFLREGRVTWANDSARKMLGVADDIIGVALNQLSPESQGILSSTGQARFHFWRQRIDPATNISRRDVFVADSRWTPEADGSHNGQIVFRDASDLAIIEKRLINTAFKDDASGLLTPVGFVDLADTTFSRVRKDERFSVVVAIYIPDLINFEPEPVVHAGIVSDIAVRICYALRGNDLAANLGNCEFAVLLSSVTKLEQALSVIKRFAARVSAPFECKGKLVRLRAMVGISIHGVDGVDAKPLLEAAKRASAESTLEDSRNYYAIAFANKEIQHKWERDAARAERIRQDVLQGRIEFAAMVYQGEGGKACLIHAALRDFSEKEIWDASEAENQALDLVRRAIEYSATIESDFFIISYPERYSKIGNNAMALAAAERGKPLMQFFSCHHDATWAEAASELRLAARWDGKTTLSTLKKAGVTMVLAPDVSNDSLLAAELSVAKQFFKLFSAVDQ